MPAASKLCPRATQDTYLTGALGDTLKFRERYAANEHLSDTAQTTNLKQFTVSTLGDKHFFQ